MNLKGFRCGLVFLAMIFLLGDAGLLLPAQSPARPTPYVNDGQRVSYFGRILQEADPKTFTVITEEKGVYGKDAMHVYLEATPIPGADPATFVVIGDGYAKDSANVFLELTTLSGADPRTFAVLEGGYAKDARRVYYNTEILLGADSQSFSIVASNIGAKNRVTFAKDKAHVFYDGGWGQDVPSIIVGADPNTFRTLDDYSYSGGYARDAHAVYFSDERVQGADPESFQSMAPYGKDKRAVYLGGTLIHGADPRTFVFLWSENANGLGYGKDALGVYYGSDRIPGADPATFEEIFVGEDGDARDKNHYYLAGELLK